MKHLLLITAVFAALTISCASAIPVLTTHIPPEPKTARVAIAVELGLADYNPFFVDVIGYPDPHWSIPLAAESPWRIREK